jgi:hypothetical protein
MREKLSAKVVFVGYHWTKTPYSTGEAEMKKILEGLNRFFAGK